MPKHLLRDRAEQQFFADPAIDRLMGYAFTLSAEVWVLRDRVARLEDALLASGALQPGDVETISRTSARHEECARDRTAFVASLMETIVGRQKSNGP